MPDPSTDPSTATEYCESCQCETRHSVSLIIVEEGSDDSDVRFSREPYRVTVCEQCGLETKMRLNDR